MPQAPDSMQPTQHPGMGYAEQPNMFWKALDGVVNGLRNYQGAQANPSLFHEPTMTAASAVGPAMQGGLDVMADPRNAWMGMGPAAGMALMGRGIRGAAKGMSDMGGFNQPVGEMRRAMDMPRPNLRQGEIPGGGQDVRQGYLESVGGLNHMTDILSNPSHPSFGFAKQAYANAPPHIQQHVNGVLQGQRNLLYERMKAMNSTSGGGVPPVGYGQ